MMSINEQVKLKEDNCFTSAFNALFFAIIKPPSYKIHQVCVVLCMQVYHAESVIIFLVYHAKIFNQTVIFSLLCEQGYKSLSLVHHAITMRT